MRLIYNTSQYLFNSNVLFVHSIDIHLSVNLGILQFIYLCAQKQCLFSKMDYRKFT